MPIPRDVTDLYLAPVALALDDRIQELAALSLSELARRVAIESDSPDYDEALRSSGLLRAVTHLIDLHEWHVSWDLRGVRLTNGDHSLVLGAPAKFYEYCTGAES